MGVERAAQHLRHAHVVLERGRVRVVDRPHGHPGDQVLHRGLCDLDLAERGQHGRDVRQEGPVRPDDQHAGPAQPFPVLVEQVRGAVQPDGRLSGAWCALDADRVREVGADEFVLFRLDGGHDVAHRPDARPFDLGGQDPARRAQFLAPVEVLVLEAGQDARAEPEPAPDRHPLRVAGAGPVEGPRDGRPPVQHHRLARLVGDVPPPDVVAPAGMVRVTVAEVEPSEEERGGRVVGQFLDPPGHVPAELLGGVRVSGDLVAGGEQGFRAFPHPAQRVPRRVEMGPFGGQFAVERGRWGGVVRGLGSKGHPRRPSGAFRVIG